MRAEQGLGGGAGEEEGQRLLRLSRGGKPAGQAMLHVISATPGSLSLPSCQAPGKKIKNRGPGGRGREQARYPGLSCCPPPCQPFLSLPFTVPSFHSPPRPKKSRRCDTTLGIDLHRRSTGPAAAAAAHGLLHLQWARWSAPWPRSLRETHCGTAGHRWVGS